MDIRRHAELTIVGVGGRFISGMSEDSTNMETIPALWHTLIDRLDEIAGRIDGPTYGLCVPLKPEDRTRDDEFLYVAGAPVSNAASANRPEGMMEQTIPPATYAVFTHEGPVDSIGETMRRIHGELLPASGHKPSHGIELERYDERFTNRDDSILEIWIPIEDVTASRSASTDS